MCLAESTKLLGTWYKRTRLLSDFNKQIQERGTELMLSRRRESAPKFFVKIFVHHCTLWHKEGETPDAEARSLL